MQGHIGCPCNPDCFIQRFHLLITLVADMGNVITVIRLQLFSQFRHFLFLCICAGQIYQTRGHRNTARLHCLSNLGFHVFQLLWCCRLFGETHFINTHRPLRHICHYVNCGSMLVQVIEIFLHSIPVQFQRRRNRTDDSGAQIVDQLFLAFLTDRRNPNTAVCNNVHGNARIDTAPCEFIIHQRQVRMGMEINEAGRNEFSCRVDGLFRLCRAQIADCGDLIAFDAYVAFVPEFPSAVQNRTVYNLYIKHKSTRPFFLLSKTI